MSEDWRLLKGLHRGEANALRQIYLKYKDDLLTVARSLVCDINTAEDCLQDVFVSLASGRRRIRSNLKGYLLRCVVNRARDHLRRTGVRSNYQIDMQRRPTDIADAAAGLVRDDETRILIRALERLSCEQREVVVLHLQGDMTFREIATMLEISVNTAQSRYRYGIEKLRQLPTKKEAI